MSDTPESGELDPVQTDEASNAADEDRSYDNLEDAMEALRASDEQETEADEQPEEPEDGEEEAETEDEADSDAEDADDADEAVDGDAEISLPDGSTITVAELEGWRAGAMRQADYTQKTTELARQREQVEQVQADYQQRLQFAETALQNITEYLESAIPPEPDISLVYQNPAEFQVKKEERARIIAEINKLVTKRREIEGHKEQASEADQKRYREGEQAKLVKAMPHLSDPARMDSFRKSVTEAAVSDFGFSQEEAAATHDARVLQLVHYARLGKKAEQNRNNAKRRVETPKQAKTGAKPAPNQKSREAMQRLSKTGSYDDALAAMRYVD